MEFFGIGMPELLVILVIAIVIFGPDKIPSMAAQVGKAVRDFRRYTSELTKEFNDATGGLKEEFTNIASDIRGELAQAQADLRSQLDLTDVLRMDTAAPVAVAAAGDAEAAVAAEPVAAGVPLPAPEPAPPPAVSESTAPITVMTPYAESLAAAEAGGVGTNGHGAASLAVPVATKADPFADLALLTIDGTAATDAVTYVATEAISLAPEPVDAAPAIVAEPAPVIAASGMNGTNGHKPQVGGSVAGSKYARRRSV
jgi:TatA/E family protein of Tat protein translocase